ncbi:dermonecrotic toxin domain-containing protein [Pseudomonas putida]|uniref:Dermonecrotic toxin N-terminal domain-containing protein n=1 Tax=Pseudomonas putida TaxID=303 RepID=A0A6I6Y1D0_PSEPU|nr:DUF6543 domain-containing protein [Pseudomonas putida]QHG67457.2 hypothetical protein C2H86_24840 [Pseudomonas putida]
MSTLETSPFDFMAAVASQFASRPRLREVLGRQLLELLLKQLPYLAATQPPLISAAPLMLDSPEPGQGWWTTQPLVDAVLAAMAAGEEIDIEPLEGRDYKLGLSGSYRFAGSESVYDTCALSGLSEPLNELIEQLPRHFAQAQLDFWRSHGSAGVSRDRWFQLLIKQAMLRNLPLQGLDARAVACVHGLLLGEDPPPVYALQVSLSLEDQQTSLLLHNLLVTGEWDEGTVVLWCAPSSVISAFESLDAFAQALCDELAKDYCFDAMTWQCLALEGDAFAQQSALLLDGLLERIEQVRYSQVEDSAALEQLFANLSDPSQAFYSGYFIDRDVWPEVLPALAASSARDCFAWQEAQFTLALYQLESKGAGSLDDIQDLHGYVSQRLAERMRALHPDEDIPVSDDIVLSLGIAAGVPGGAGVGSGGGEPLVPAGSKSLTEFAIGNLAALQGAIITGMARRDGGVLPKWLGVDFAKQLVADVDIGGHYPRYVAERLDDTERRPTRVSHFAREWRASLLFAGLQAKLAGRLSERGLQCVTDFCRGHIDALAPTLSLLPLAFKRRPTTTVRDVVAGMYVLMCSQPSVVVLYRPLYPDDPLRSFASEQAMLEAIIKDHELERSLLEWMAPTARPVYDKGGFAEPHIEHIGIDPFLNFESPAPASLAVELWDDDVDEKLFVANRNLLVALADLRTTSTAENRWATLLEGAWLVFNTVTLIFNGPIASVTWLLQTVKSLEADLEAISDGEPFDRSAACVDVLLTLGVTMAHLRQPVRQPMMSTRLPDARFFEGPLRREAVRQWVDPVSQPRITALSGGLQGIAGHQLDFSWRGNQGFNSLPAAKRAALRAMRVSVRLDDLAPLDSGDGQGTYRIGTRHYVEMAADVYEVNLLPEGVRVVGKQGAVGPWLSLEHGVWRVDSGLRLLGGMPRSMTAQRLAATLKGMKKTADALTDRVNALSALFTEQGKEVLRLQGQIETLERLKASEVIKAQANHAMVQMYAERITQLEPGVQEERLKSIATMEQVVKLDDNKIALFDQMLEPKYRGGQEADFEQSLRDQRALLTASQITNNDFVFNELWRLADYPKHDALVTALSGKKLHEVRQPYQAFRQNLERVVALQERMLVANAQLDKYLPLVSPDAQVNPGVDARTMAQLIGQRAFTTEDLRLHHVLNLADLALHMDSATGLRKLVKYRGELGGKLFQSAARAHGESIMANLAVADRVSILQEAWDEYSAAIVNSDLIAADGGSLVDPALLKQYKDHVLLLKEDAGRRLVEAREVLEGRAGRVLDTGIYPVPTQAQHVIRNSEGVIIIATEEQEEGHSILVVREPLNQNVVQRFDLREGQWVERIDAVPEAVIDEESASVSSLAQAQALMQDNEAILRQARLFVSQDISGKHLARLFDEQIARLQAFAVGLSEADSEAARLVGTARGELQAHKDALLTQLYTQTSYPDAQALLYLHGRKLIKVEYVGPRQLMVDGSAFDEYKVMRLKAAGESKGKALWAVHFHLPSAGAMADAFTRGHLKLWAQRFESNANSGFKRDALPGRRVHYGPLTLEQARGIIPF